MPGVDAFKDYGARGIKICDRWGDFALFVIDMGERPHGKTLDRIDNDGHYEPTNCRWATPKEQRENSRSPIQFVEFEGRIQCAADWAKELGISSTSMYRRLRKWPVERALTKPRRATERVGKEG